MNLSFAKWIDKIAGRAACFLLSAARTTREMIAPRDTLVGEPRTIVLIKFWGLGNIVLLLPVFRALRRRYPSSRILLVTLARNREILEGVEDLDETLLVEDRNLFAILRTYLGALRRARAARPDLVVDFEQFARASAIFAFLSGAPHTVGLDTPGHHRGRMFHARVPYDDGIHTSETFLGLARAAGVAARTYEPLPPPVFEADRDAADAFLRDAGAEAGAGGGPVFLFHPGSGDNFLGRRWATANFARLADHLLERDGGIVVVTGSASEAPLAEEVRAAASRGDRVVSAAGKLGVRALAALCGRAALVVSNDTSPVHLASAMGRPVLGLFGPNTPVLYGPLSPGSVAFYHRTPCSPCLTNFNYKTSFCRMPVCIRTITVEEVAAAADRIMDGARTGAAPAAARVEMTDIPGPREFARRAGGFEV